MNPDPDQILYEEMKAGNQKAFEALFRAYYPFLCHYATRILKDASTAEEIVQELFLKQWENRQQLNINSSVKSYLFRAVKNHCLNHLRHLKVHDEYIKATLKEQVNEQNEDYEEQYELLKKIEEAIASMPEKRREIFRLNRQEGLKYHEIAERLSISVKTVETHIGLALKTLRSKFGKQISIFLLFI